MREATTGVDIGVKVDGNYIESVRFSEDEVIMTKSVRILQELIYVKY